MSRISLINYFGNDGPLGFLELENAEEEEVSYSSRHYRLPHH
jgi:hypothetical protein